MCLTNKEKFVMYDFFHLDLGIHISLVTKDGAHFSKNTKNATCTVYQLCGLFLAS